MTPTDPLYAQQWHFKLMGDIERVWDDYDGSGVTVVVYDEGTEYTHPDLAANFDTSFFTYNGTVYDPTPIDDNSGHGTSCAGLIGAAAGNGIGGVGVAPGVTLSAVNYLDVIQYEPQAVYDAAMLYAADFDIMSNSWGYNGSYISAQNLSKANSLASQDIALWQEVVETGRDGLGTVIVKAAGNETNNVNGDGWNVSRYTITVAATDSKGNATYYTNFGSAVLVTAPAAAVTTDLTGNAGYNGNNDTDPVAVDYTSTFNGTSAATPVVAGVVALMLDANPNLGWRDVQNILALSAAHTGSALGAATGTRYEVGTWMTMNGNQWNGGGTEFHLSYGYGMVDSFAAVRFAEAWAAIYGNKPLTSANELSASFGYSGTGVSIPESDGTSGTGRVSLAVNSTSTIEIEAISIELTMTHSDGRNMNLWLRAPDGTMIPLYAGDGNSRTWDGGTTWTFEVDALRGYSAQGTWSIVAEDMVTGDRGTLDDVSFTFYGTQASVNDVYNFTQDFQLMAAYESSRKVIDDFNGGTDTLNFAAIQSNMNITLTAGGAIKFGGTQVASVATGSDEFERLYAGDGNDVITGNTLGNKVWGARGLDSLYGAQGNDTLIGGDQNDFLRGDGGNDQLSGSKGNDTLQGSGGNDVLSGDQGTDYFVFAANAGSDTINGWQDNSDTLKLDDAMWGGGKTISQVLSTYAHVVGSNTVLDFGTTKITLANFTNVNSLADDIILT